jgi:hypothetical protein
LFTLARELHISYLTAPWAILPRGRNHMASKNKVRKSTKSLKKSKKLEATKPLLKWSGSAGGSDVPTGN